MPPRATWDCDLVRPSLNETRAMYEFGSQYNGTQPIDPYRGPKEGPVAIYYHWERDDLPEKAMGRCSFLPMDSIEDTAEDAETKVYGRTVNM